MARLPTPPAPRGPLPSGVYWRRRLALLSAALVLVLGLGKVLSLATDGSGGGDDPSARQAGATTSTTPSKKATGKATGNATGKHHGKGHGKGKHTSSPTPTPTPTPTPPPPAQPSGPCPDDDVFITPTVAGGVAGSPVTITLNLATSVTEACTWQVSPDTVTMKIVSGSDVIWESRECPAVIPTQDVVVRRATATPVPVVWNAKRSDQYCTDRTAWALAGSYHVLAAAFAGEPTDVQFELTTPAPAEVTETATPTESATSKPKH